MIPKMRYRLGLDIGSTSIGWCMVRLNEQDVPVAVIRMGVRIFSNGCNPYNGNSLAVARREARQMRRRRDRFLRRKEKLISALTRLGFFPKDEKARKALANLDPYVLRKKGLHEPLTGPEFARAVFHINQRRGFRSNRKVDKAEEESGAMKKAIKDLQQKLKEEHCQTLGEWLANRHANRMSVRARPHGATKKDRTYDFYASRDMVEQEFDALWAKQAMYNPGLFQDAARDKIKGILLFQRPLKPVKPGRCALIPDEERAPSAIPSVQRFRIYQELNNLRLVQDFQERPLTREQRDTIAELLERHDVRFAEIRKVLRLPNAVSFNLEDGKRDRLKGNATAVSLSKSKNFGAIWFTFSADRQDTIVDKLLNEEDETQLIRWLVEKTGVDEIAAERIANAGLPEGFSNLGRTAIARVLPQLMQDVVVYSTAVQRAGFNSHSLLSHAERTGEVMEALPYYGEPLQRHVGFGTGEPSDPPEKRYGRIANPTVHIGLNELRKVVNALIRRYGHPSEIVVEMARDLKLSRKRKEEIQKEQKKRQDLNENLVTEACAVLGLTPGHLDKAKRRQLSQKMQLWVELNPKDVANRRCPYTGEQISIGRLLSDEVEIEHILPWDKTFDDGMNNKTVAFRRSNRVKGNRTPYEAFGREPVPGYDYSAILERVKSMPKEKAKRFAPDGYERWLKENKDFLARALNDTAYLSRIAKEYLSLICPPNKVRAIPGRMTALLRGKFGLNSLLSESGSKNRDDHRHHAIDAAVVAVTDQGLLQRFAKACASAREKQLDRLVEEMPMPWPTYRSHVERAVNSIVVSFKPDHGYQGAIHEKTAWGLATDGQATRRIRPADGEPRQRETKNRRLIPINSTRDRDRHGLDDDGNPVPYKGYEGRNNDCIEIWRNEKGRWKSDVISTFAAYQVVKELGEEKAVQKLRNPTTTLSGKPLVMRLMIDDLVRFEVDGNTRVLRVANISANGQVFFAEHHESNVDSRNKDKSNPFKYISKYAGSLQKASARRIVVNEIGDMRDLGFEG